MLWEWLVIPQRLFNAQATFNLLVTQLLCPHRAYAQKYVDAIFVHSPVEQGRSDVDNHIDHLRAVIECMRTNSLYANASRCIFSEYEITFLDALLGSKVLGGSCKVESHSGLASPEEPKGIRKWLGLANYLHKYSENYADIAKPLCNLLKKDVE